MMRNFYTPKCQRPPIALTQTAGLLAGALLWIADANSVAAGTRVACTLEYLCTNIAPWQAVDDAPQKVEALRQGSDEIQLSLGADTPIVLKITQENENMLTAHGTQPEIAASYTFSRFADGVFAYSVQTFVGQGVSLTGLGKCGERI